MRKSVKFSPEVRERAVRLVLEHRTEHPSQWAAIESIAPKIGCTPQTLLSWVRQHERDTGLRDGVTTAERERIKALEREVRELRQPVGCGEVRTASFAIDAVHYRSPHPTNRETKRPAKKLLRRLVHSAPMPSRLT